MMKDKMIELRLAEFAENYLEKVYYFCLKRTNSSHDYICGRSDHHAM